MVSHLTFNGVLLLFLLLLARSLEDAFIVEVGKNAYLPCNYSITAYGTPVPVCWGKGPCPFSHCGANNVLSTDERNVTCQKSRRYQLKGNFLKGDVSLTIENVTLADGGTYCCRVKFPGLGNDKKVNLELDIRPAKFAPAVPARGYPTPTSPRTLTTKGDGSGRDTLLDSHCSSWIVNYFPEPLSCYHVFQGCISILISQPLCLYCYGRSALALTTCSSLVDLIVKIGALQNTVVMRPRGEDKVCIMEDSLHVKN
ncbi:hypothetical protein ACRRTK_006616 [Alexandromys fortis]